MRWWKWLWPRNAIAQVHYLEPLVLRQRIELCRLEDRLRHISDERDAWRLKYFAAKQYVEIATHTETRRAT